MFARVPNDSVHRDVTEAFAEQVASSRVAFKSMSYNDLWNESSANVDLAEHVANLRVRHAVSLTTAGLIIGR